MKEKILIVEDEFIVANDLRKILTKAGYLVAGTASSVIVARQLVDEKKPDWVLLDITLKGALTGIDLAWELARRKIPFLYISANTTQTILNAVKATQPYGFLIKPFREKDLLVMLDIARYRRDFEKGLFVDSGNTRVTPDKRPIEGLIGNSHLLQDVIEKIRLVAPTQTTVLILGESGTGKEKIAQAIHQLSDHAAKPLIVVNCAALAPTLIESELFGHERGAFTGANTLRIGKFEQASGGTIFLDEIGEMPLESQVKLLRVLQEKEIDRLGSNHSIKINVRVIAATSRQLEKEVAEGRFRLDLYYRLNVFPIEVPDLRSRKEDIPLLADYFMKKYAVASRRTINSISPAALQQFNNYNWPGNIRELEHLIERTVLITSGNEIQQVTLPEMKQQPVRAGIDQVVKTLEDVEREHIMAALKTCNGKVSGIGGAAELLKIPPSTLYSKMKKHGITQAFI